jgi:CDP-glycerol glycerophosphotransferase
VIIKFIKKFGGSIPVLFKITIASIASNFYRNNDIWLISERPSDARDNGYFLFKYVRENHPEINAVYAIKKSSSDFRRIKELGNWVEFGGFKHYIYYLSAIVNISSHISVGKPGGTITSYLENKGFIKTKKAFLQHGVIQNTPNFCLYQKSGADLFVCGAKPEYDFVLENFGYPKGNVQYLGLCRFDNLHNHISKKQILIMPTWRVWLKSEKVSMNNTFIDSDYFKNYNDLINNDYLINILETHNIDLIFYPHNDMQEFIDQFSTRSDNIVIANKTKYDLQQLLKESSLLVTDYSSVFFDFAYMKKPLMYFQFDKEDFYNRQYEQGYFDYEKHGFGPVYYKLDNLIEGIDYYIQKDFSMDKEYKKRSNVFFPLYDKSNCKRNFNAIKQIVNYSTLSED